MALCALQLFENLGPVVQPGSDFIRFFLGDRAVDNRLVQSGVHLSGPVLFTSLLESVAEVCSVDIEYVCDPALNLVAYLAIVVAGTVCACKPDASK